MTSLSLHPTPSVRIVLREQLRLAGLLLRRGAVLMLAGYLVVLIGIAVQVSRFVARGMQGSARLNFNFTPEVSLVTMLVALVLPLILWEGEDPTQRWYQWLMPLPRHVHALARVFAGWAWMMVATALFLVGIIALALIAERITGTSQPYPPEFAVWEWLVPFTSATVAYLFASAAAVGTRRPLIWILGIAALYAAAIGLLSALGMSDTVEALRAIWSGSLGASSAVAGKIMSPTPLGRGVQPDLSRWLAATTLWGSGAVLLLWIVAYRHRDAN